LEIDRKKLLDEELSRCVKLLIEHEHPEKVLIFGTLATGQVHRWSDIDMVVVTPTQLPFFQRLTQMRRLLRPRVGMDIMVYTPDEFDRLCKERPFFKEEIICKGKVVYERGS